MDEVLKSHCVLHSFLCGLAMSWYSQAKAKSHVVDAPVPLARLDLHKMIFYLM